VAVALVLNVEKMRWFYNACLTGVNLGALMGFADAGTILLLGFDMDFDLDLDEFIELF